MIVLVADVFINKNVQTNFIFPRILKTCDFGTCNFMGIGKRGQQIAF